MATFEEYRDRWIQQNKSLDDKINLVAADVAKNSQNIEYNAGAIEELAGMVPSNEAKEEEK